MARVNQKTLVTVRMPNETIWTIPAEIIARARAVYYVSRDVERGYTPKEDYEKEVDAQIAYVFGSPEEIIDWAMNNMDWADVKDYAVQRVVENTFADYERAWSTADMQIEQ